MNKDNRLKVNNRNKWLMVGSGGVLCVVAIGMLVVYIGNPQQMVMGAVGVFGLIDGAVVVYLGLKRGEVVTHAAIMGRDLISDANTLLVQRDRLEYANVDQKLIPEDYQWRKCRNDGIFYRVLIQAIDNAKSAVEYNGRTFNEFILPDTQYRDPREFANNLNIPSHRRLAKRKATLIQNIAPWILVVAIIIMGIIFVMNTPPPVLN